jgi:anion-transporting  ArsA/GET3 family ATPase
MIRALVEQKKIVVCVGPGGVGKTTTAAALGATAARLGRKTLVCTIDPAPRLADALGVGGLGPEPRPVPAEACRALGIPAEGAGRLFAVRLDTARAFARLVDEQVADPEMRRRIFDNAIYRQVTTSLTGSQEYAATLALYELAREGAYDLIVLDTPPTANALDFLDAPKRIAAAVSSPALSWFARPPQDEGGTGGGLRRLSLRRLRAGGALVLRRLGKLVGSRFLDDVGAFLTDFQQVLGGFLERAKAVDLLLRGPDTAFLLVLVPAVAAVDEALYFHGRLRDAGVPLSAFIANRVQPAPGITEAGALAKALRATPAFADLTDAAIAEAATRLASLAGTFAAQHAGERRELARLRAQAPGTEITQIPLLDHDVDNLSELRVVGEALLAG